MSTTISVLLVDDEPLALENVYEMVDWQAHGFTVVGRATSGRKALQLFEQWRPHIVITDISMSPMSGMELGARIHSLAPETKLLFLTAYRDFDYARQALELRAANYLLKHEISNDRLLTQLLEIKRSIKAEVIDREHALRLMLRNLLAGRFAPQDGPLLAAAKERLERQTAMFYWEVGCRVCADGGRYADRVTGESTGMIERALLEQVEQVQEVIILEQERGQLALVALPVPNSQLIVQYSMQSTAYALQRLLSLHTGSEPTLVMSALDRRDPGQLAADMQAVYDYALLLPPRSLFLPEQARAAESTPSRPYAAWKELIQSREAWDELQTRLQHMVRHGDLTEMRGFLSQLPGWMAPAQVPLQRTLGSGIAEIVDAVIALLASHLEQASPAKGYSRWVVRAMEDVQQHYADPDLTLDAIAARLQISSIHLRTTFKRETGQSLLDYTTDYRIRVARKLLEEGELKIYEVAERVGYKTSQYFSQVFKRMTGSQPKDYNGQESGG